MTEKDREFITVVSGLPRSGTSMMMRMFEAGGMPVLTDGIRQPDADNPNGYYEFEPVKQLSRNVSWLADARGKAVKMVYRLLYSLPPHHQYKVILMNRHIGEIIASQAVMLQRQGKKGPFSTATLTSLFTGDLQKLQTWLQTQPNFVTLNLNYNSIVMNPHASVNEIERFLNCPLDIKAMTRVFDISLYRQRQHI